jgi:membrane associated rhomboid family serine protease
VIPLRDRNPADLFPAVTIGLIAANVLIFFFEISNGAKYFQNFTLHFAAVPVAFLDAPFAPAQLGRVFASMFLHGSLLHLAGNMLFLWIFGNNIEDYLGHVKFAVFYLACGMAGALAHILTHASSSIPMIGASGAISGVLGAYFLLFPRARVLTLVPIIFFLYFIEVPAFIFLGIFILLQLLFAHPKLMGASASPEGGALIAHIGGFAAGIVLLLVFRKRRGFRRRIQRS